MTSKRLFFAASALLAAICNLPIGADAAAAAMVDPATKIDFSDSLGGRPLFGVGVRRKGPIKVRIRTGAFATI